MSSIAPIALLLPPTFDTMVTPPPLASPAHQADWKARWTARDYVPASLVADIALEDRRAARFSPIPRHCIAVWSSSDKDEGASNSLRVIAHASGQSRDHVALTVSSHSSSSNNGEGHLRSYLGGARVGVSTPIHQLVFSPSTHQTLLAARSLYAIDILTISHDHSSPQHISASTSKFTSHQKEIMHFAWSRHQYGGGGAGCYLRRDGCLYHAADCTHTNPHSKPALAWRSPQSDDPNDRNDGCCCEYTSLHPSQVAVALRRMLGLVDLRSPSASAFTPFLTPPPTPTGIPPYYSALAPAPPQCGGPFLLAAATATDILLFDVRKPGYPLRSWSAPTEWLGPSVKSMHHIDSMLIDTLIWQSSVSQETTGTILAASSWSGKAIACQWDNTQRVVSAKPGHLDLWGGFEQQNSCDELNELSFTQASTQAQSSVLPHNSTTISLWDAELSMPRGLMSCVHEGKIIQYRRKCLREMMLQTKRKSTEPNKLWKPVLLRPSKRSWSPFSLGLAVTEDSEIYVLSPTQEVVIGKLHMSKRPCTQGDAWPVWLAVSSGSSRSSTSSSSSDSRNSKESTNFRYSRLAAEKTIYEEGKKYLKGEKLLRLIAGVDVLPEFRTEDPLEVEYSYHEKLLDVAVKEYQQITEMVQSTTNENREEQEIELETEIEEESGDATKTQLLLTHPKFGALLKRAGILDGGSPEGHHGQGTQNKNTLFRKVEGTRKVSKQFPRISFQIPSQSLEGQQALQQLRDEWNDATKNS